MLLARFFNFFHPTQHPLMEPLLTTADREENFTPNTKLQLMNKLPDTLVRVVLTNLDYSDMKNLGFCSKTMYLHFQPWRYFNHQLLEKIQLKLWNNMCKERMEAQNKLHEALHQLKKLNPLASETSMAMSECARITPAEHEFIENEYFTLSDIYLENISNQAKSPEDIFQLATEIEQSLRLLQRYRTRLDAPYEICCSIPLFTRGDSCCEIATKNIFSCFLPIFFGCDMGGQKPGPCLAWGCAGLIPTVAAVAVTRLKLCLCPDSTCCCKPAAEPIEIPLTEDVNTLKNIRALHSGFVFIYEDIANCLNALAEYRQSYSLLFKQHEKGLLAQIGFLRRKRDEFKGEKALCQNTFYFRR